MKTEQLECGVVYEIERLGQAIAGFDTFIFKRGEKYEQTVKFIMFESGHKRDRWFATLDPTDIEPIAFFQIRGPILIPQPVEKVTRLGFVKE